MGADPDLVIKESIGLCIVTGMALASDTLVEQIEKDVSGAGKRDVSNIVQDDKKTFGASETNAAANGVIALNSNQK